MRGRSKVRIKTDDPDSLATARASHQITDQGPVQESEANKRIRAIKRRIGYTRTQANRLTNLARDIHAKHKSPVKPGDNTVPGGDPRSKGILSTAMAYRKQAVNLGYSFVPYIGQREDATDGGQDIFEEFNLIDLTTIMACPKLLLLGDKTRAIAATWDQTLKQLIHAEIKATNASPKKGMKTCPGLLGTHPPIPSSTSNGMATPTTAKKRVA